MEMLFMLIMLIVVPLFFGMAGFAIIDFGRSEAAAVRYSQASPAEEVVPEPSHAA